MHIISKRLNNSKRYYYKGWLKMAEFGQKIEATMKIIKSLTDNEKHSLHVGEVMACWTYLSFVESIVTFKEVGLNTTTNPGLRELYQDGLKVAKSHKEELSGFMRKEGVTLPDPPVEKPVSDPKAIPLGAKFTDDELANTLTINFVYAADMCATAASQCLRTDVGLMFIRFQIDKLSLGFKARNLMKRKGWLKTPPYYQPPGSPNQV